MKIGVFLPESPWGAIDEGAMNKGLGGRETALVQLAVNWARTGHEVYAFVPRDDVRYSAFAGVLTANRPPHGLRAVQSSEGYQLVGHVTWIPCEQVIDICAVVNPDVFISWENVPVLEALRASGYTGITAIEMQVAHLDTHIPVSSVADYVCVLSKWAGDFLRTQHSDLTLDQIRVFPNGVDLARFDEARKKQNHTLDADRLHFIYSSSPDRGLHHLLRMWQGIRHAVHVDYELQAELHVCYGIENFVAGSKWSHREDGQRAVQIERMIDQEGVVYHGKIGQDMLAALMVDCDLMLYPCDTMSPTETGCISIVEALAAGTPVVTTNCDCLGSEFGDVTVQQSLPFRGAQSYKDFAIAAMDALNPEDYEARVEAGLKFAQHRDWKLIAANWIAFFDDMLSFQEAA